MGGSEKGGREYREREEENPIEEARVVGRPERVACPPPLQGTAMLSAES